MVSVQHPQAQGWVVSLNVGGWLNTVQKLLNKKKKKCMKRALEKIDLMVMEIVT